MLPPRSQALRMPLPARRRADAAPHARPMANIFVIMPLAASSEMSLPSQASAAPHIVSQVIRRDAING